jgi:hypothetical protein
MTDSYLDYFTQFTAQVNNSPTRIGLVEVATQAASITATDFSGTNLVGGLYRISYTAQITRAAGTSSSLTVTFQWTRGGVTQTFQRAAVTGNTIQTHDEFVFLVRADANSPVTYATTYATVGAPTMQYALDVVLEQVRA